MIKHILVPVDGSAHAKRALDLASELATPLAAKLALIHVMSRIGSDRVPPELEDYAALEHVKLTEHDLLRGVAERVLNAAERQATEQGVAQVTTALEEGNPARRIVEYAETQGVDLIVIGSRGLSDLGGLLLGSVSHRVAHLAGCGCLLVK